jgi:hypothetical protein
VYANKNGLNLTRFGYDFLPIYEIAIERECVRGKNAELEHERQGEKALRPYIDKRMFIHHKEAINLLKN